MRIPSRAEAVPTSEKNKKVGNKNLKEAGEKEEVCLRLCDFLALDEKLKLAFFKQFPFYLLFFSTHLNATKFLK